MNFIKDVIYSAIVVIFFTTNLSSQLSSEKVDLLEKQVVRIVNSLNSEGTKFGSGTGFLISSAGYIITNEHVIDKSYGLEVYLGDSNNTEKVGLANKPPTLKYINQLGSFFECCLSLLY